MSNSSDIEKLPEPFKAIIGNQELNYQILDLLPIPIEIFAPDGMSIFINRAWQKLNNITDANTGVGKYNLKNDPVCLEILGQENIDKVFRGEVCFFPDFPVPIQDAFDRGVIGEKPFEAATMDMFLQPIWDGDVFACTICFATVKNMYKGRADITQAQKYIDEHLMDEFDLDKIASSVNLSSRHFRRIFKEVTGNTPLEYYKGAKIRKIQEKLLDESLSIEQAFTESGVDYRSKTYRNLLKKETGLSPTEYRKANQRKTSN